MPYEIVMPQLGLTMTEGSVTSWVKQPGERVEKGEILFTVQTDKVEMEVESFGSGYLGRILVGPEQVVAVGTLLATLSDEPPSAETFEAATPASPRARRLARELGVDLSRVKTQGKRITEDDVRQYHQANQVETPRSSPEIRPSAARKAIARRTTESFQSAPHFYLGVEANASVLVSLRESLNKEATRRGRAKLTYTDFFLKALAGALAEQPNVNSYWRDDAIVKNSSIDVGCAVQAPEGLVVGVLRNADRLDLFSTAEHRGSLVEKARAGQLTLAEMEGGSATLSNLGTSGIDWFQAILNPPQSVILATGAIATRPVVVVGGQIQAQPTVHLNLSVDHRVLDGVSGSAFLKRVQEMIERPHLLLL